MWRILVGDMGRLVDGRFVRRQLSKFWVVAKALNTCLVYKHATAIRRLFSKYLDHDDSFELTRRAEDISYCILAEMLTSDSAGSWGSDGPDEMAVRLASEQMDKAFREAIGGHETRDRMACMERGRTILEEWVRDDPPSTQVELVRNVLQEQNETYNYSLYREGQSTRVRYLPMRELADFDVLVFGHFHRPRAGQSAFDDGCMLTNPKNKTVQSFLVIENDGRIRTSWASSDVSRMGN